MNALVKPEAEYEVETMPDAGTLAALQGAEINQQIATARAYPRSIKAFHNQALELATLSEGVALECMYSVPRGGKKITGPSARLAEIIASCWGNCRYAARVVEEQKDFIVAQGVFHDLEKNALVSFEVKRRIVDKYGKRFDVDMIAVTGNAACSIALRNAVFKGVPKALWVDVYDRAVETAIGKNLPMAKRREMAVEYFTKAGATKEQIFKVLDVAAESEITMDDLVWMTGVRAAIKEGEYTLESVFSDKAEARGSSGRVLNMATGKYEEEGEAIEVEKPKQKAARKPAAKKEAKPAAPPPPPEPEVIEAEIVEEDVSENEPSEEGEKIDMPDKPPLDIDAATENPGKWVDTFIAYYEALPEDMEDAFMLETDYIRKQIRKLDQMGSYQKMAAAIASK